jgi:ubiquinone/menaquinone biosynthesis C-methylase UbiE
MEKHAPEAYGPFARTIIEFKAKYLKRKQATILDLGCGPGFLAFELRNRDPALRVIGIDPDPRMVEIARVKAKERDVKDVLVRIGQAERIPLGAEPVDVVVSLRTLHHWQSVPSALQEIHRVLRLGGLVIVRDVNRAYPQWKRRLRYVFLGLLARHDAARHWPSMQEHWLSPNDVQPLLDRAGFHPEFTDAGADFTLVARKLASTKTA